MRTCIVIVNYRTAALVADCLHSLVPQVGDLAGGRVLVIDNDSGDGSREAIAATVADQGWQAWVQVLSGGRNGGFSFGNNIGICEALSADPPPDCVLLLNPDTVVRPGAIAALVSFMRTNPQAGIVGSQLENAAGGIECSAHRAPSPLGDLDAGARLGVLSRLLERHVISPPVSPQAHPCDWVSGASMLVRREVLRDIGLMDEGFFLYFEEVDYCCRARAAGWQVWYAPESRVLHLEGASTGIHAKARRRARYWYDSRRRFFVKHHGVAGLLLADGLWAAGRLSFLLRRALRLGGHNDVHADPRWFMFDLLWGDLRALLAGRLRIDRAGSRP
jgi:GT2 family glycosyltransferase